jgi:hypothetical protein
MDLKIVKLSKEDMDLFEYFKKHKNDFIIFLKYGVFDFKNGSAIISRDSDGTIRRIEIDNVVYRS